MRAVQVLARNSVFSMWAAGASSRPFVFPQAAPRQRRSVLSNTKQTDALLSFGLAFVGGYGDAASFVLAKTFTGHVTGNLVLAAIAVAAHDWRAALRPLKAWSSWPFLPTIMGMEVILIVAASLALASRMAHGVEIFVIICDLCLSSTGATKRSISSCRRHQRSHNISDRDDYESNLYRSRTIRFSSGSSAHKCSRSKNKPSLRNLDCLCPRRWDRSGDGHAF
jgi:uncharacterized membrane protein YdcZ (DUF606 family)